MAKMGSRKHLKRYKAPKSWPIHPKENTWTVKPAPGTFIILTCYCKRYPWCCRQCKRK